MINCKKTIFYLTLLLCITMILCSCKASEKDKTSDFERTAGSTSNETEAKQDTDNPFEIPEEWEKKIAESHNMEPMDLSLDLEDYDYYLRRGDENAEEYYPEFSETFDDYSRYSYNGTDKVGKEPQTGDDMYERVLEADRKDDKYLYKGRNEDLFTWKDSDSITMHDSAPYKYVFGYDKPSKEVLYRTLEENKNLPEKYKEVFRAQIDDWYQNPGIDLTILNENLYTLDLMECTSMKLAMSALSPTALACYRHEENTIYVKENSQFNDKFIAILRHEFTHSSRSYLNRRKDKIQVMTGFYTQDYSALYADEALVTLFTSYENVAGVYPLIVNCYRIVIENCDYSFSDYSNHSVYELRDKVNYYLGDIAPADDIIKGIETIGQYIYSPIDKAKYSITADDVKDALKLIIKICIKNNPDITAEEVYNKLSKDITSKNNYEEFLTREIVGQLFEDISK